MEDADDDEPMLDLEGMKRLNQGKVKYANWHKDLTKITCIQIICCLIGYHLVQRQDHIFNLEFIRKNLNTSSNLKRISWSESGML